MVFGKLAHYAIDAILLSTVVAGVKRATGFTCVSLPNYVVLSTAPRNPLFSFSSVSTQSPSPTLQFVHGLNDILALEKQRSIPFKER